MFYYKTPSAPEPIGGIEMKNATIKDSGSFTFQIITTTRNWFFKGSDNKNSQEWITVLKNASVYEEIQVSVQNFIFILFLFFIFYFLLFFLFYLFFIL